jgi:hypothetical protein
MARPRGTHVETTGPLHEAYDRIPGVVGRAVADLDADGLTWRPAPDANPIGWLVWHLARVQDDHVAEVAGDDQVYASDGWPARFGRPDGDTDTGYGATTDEVGGFRPVSAAALVDYLDAVTARTHRYLDTIGSDDLDVVIDDSYDPPVTLGARLVSVLSDGLQHAGQAAYVRGILDARG